MRARARARTHTHTLKPLAVQVWNEQLIQGFLGENEIICYKTSYTL